MIGLTLIDDKGNWIRIEYNKVGSWELILHLGNLLPNVIWRLEQVLREFSKEVIIPWDSNESGNAWKLVRL